MALSAAALVWFLAGGHAVRASGFILACVLLVAMPLVVPWLLRTVCGRARPRGLGPAMSLRTLAVRLQSTSFAVAALAVTVSMLVGITLMIGSFRRTLETWIDLSLEADVYVTTESWLMGGEQAVLGDVLADSLAFFPGVRAADLQRHMALRTADGRLVYLNGIARRGQQGERWAIRVPLLAGEPREVERAMREEGAVLIAEPLARKAHLAVGDTLRLVGPRGPFALPIAGIGYDYSTDSGTAFVTRKTLDRLVGPGETHNLALYLEPGVPVDQQIDRLRAHFGGLPLEFRSNARLRSEILEIFEETFAVTRILQVMALLIAVCGISLTLIILARERAVELALLRALGATRGQIFRLNLGEGAAMGLGGLAIGLAGGAVLAVILILLVNRAYFGWTIRLGLPWQDLVRQAAWILAAAVAASVYPAFRGSRTAATELTREDLQ